MPFQSSLLRAPAGEFISGTHCEAGQSLRYKLYRPANHEGQTLPLVVMLHGCNQNADDFAAGTAMNQRARSQGFFVLYPEQAHVANPNGCWNWFVPEHQQRGSGEPALLASLTLAVVQQYGINHRQVFIAGLSAGGAMAGVMANAYPELFAAVGVHSGLPIGTASNMDEALTAMNRGDSSPVPVANEALPQHASIRAHHTTPIIVFHGDQDSTVHPNNGEQVVKAALGDTPTQIQVQQGSSSSGRRYTRQIYTNTQHQVLAEHWLVHGTGHAWSGGSLQGSYTDRHGPDASAEMLRFFFSQVN